MHEVCHVCHACELVNDASGVFSVSCAVTSAFDVLFICLFLILSFTFHCLYRLNCCTRGFHVNFAEIVLCILVLHNCHYVTYRDTQL